MGSVLLINVPVPEGVLEGVEGIQGWEQQAQ
jgi:hypothetical protein